MRADAIRQQYERKLQQQVFVRRYAPGGSARVKFESPSCRARVTYRASPELIANIKQGDLVCIVLVADIETGGIVLPITTDDFIFFEGQEFKIISIIRRDALDGTPIAYELQIRG